MQSQRLRRDYVISGSQGDRPRRGGRHGPRAFQGPLGEKDAGAPQVKSLYFYLRCLASFKILILCIAQSVT